MHLEAAKKDYLTEIEIRKYSPKTVRVYDTNLDLFLRFCRERAGNRAAYPYRACWDMRTIK